ncbi:carboxymuconolactone decarboxylase family protein [Actinacidiphila glaucinigra]|uniref:Alkylhydroperoxidase AhpD family core domain-containing protein n=1 Tax=Actinacidiphila glaucinigra TaxID=235986 RepID=A0A239MUH7_9ACTN|nr:carboxymuconolactone decarboxylase family protein [Actinacidiphila glaucinigra]SNT45903.1 alkylhydroperoxidase AhpD family core domain-containing protein [Actinacidiphila glaucinigra]
MTLVPLVARDQIDAVDLPLIQAGEQSFGKLLNTWLAIANSPGMFATYLPFVRAVTGPGELDGRIQELTAVYVSLLNHCRYTTSHRCYSALAKGVSEADLERLAAGDFSSFSSREQLALRFTRALTVDHAVTSRDDSVTGIDPEVLAQVRDSFKPRELVEFVMSVGLWNALTRFHRVMDLDLDLGEPPSAVDAAV